MDCVDCGKKADPRFDDVCLSRRDKYCAKCIKTCVYCHAYCCVECSRDELDYLGLDIEEPRHDCLVDGTVTCSETCQYRYCPNCLEPCSKCDRWLIPRGNSTCRRCS